jgi:oligogalacturonide lyase
VSLSRRSFVSLVSTASLGLGAEKPLPLPSEVYRYADPATEFPVFRLTDPAHTGLLPSFYTRCVSRHSSFLLYSSDRSGEFQAYRMDLKNGQSRQLTMVQQLLPATVTLVPDEKACAFAADGAIHLLNLGNAHQHEMYPVPQGYQLASGLAFSEDGQYAAFVEKKAGSYRLRLLNAAKGGAQTVLESAEEIADPTPRPKRAGILYRLGDRELHVVNFDGGQNQRLKVSPGGLGPALWSQDGRNVEYLNYPEDPHKLHTIREYTPDTNEDRLVSPTTQFVHFGRNSDASVFVGASGSKASPYLLLLVRAVQRELTLCEHKASDPRLVTPVFSPNSQRVFFQSDRHGKLAIYTMNVERLVEETE